MFRIQVTPRGGLGFFQDPLSGVSRFQDPPVRVFKGGYYQSSYHDSPPLAAYEFYMHSQILAKDGGPCQAFFIPKNPKMRLNFNSLHFNCL